MKHYKRVLTIAGSDSGGGAGTQADIKTISANGCFATCAITAVTVQNTIGVTGIHSIPSNIIKGQIEAVLDDIGTDSVKIGMLATSATIAVVKEALEKYMIKDVVLDPVMVATSGDKLLEDDAIESLCNQLVPLARVITPNVPEAEILLNKKLEHQDDMPSFAKELAEKYGVSVLLKAGHMKDERLIDIFYNNETSETLELESKRIHTENTHGTGCTLSSAFASMLAQGFDLNESARRAKDYINGAIVAGADYKIGHGHGAVKHFYKLWN
ncbi:MAG: bifunctional hydroxymethylpyrimidine kinase/phosphomethylpyrimidine kinase [Bacteroidales bacterium]